MKRESWIFYDMSSNHEKIKPNEQNCIEKSPIVGVVADAQLQNHALSSQNHRWWNQSEETGGCYTNVSEALQDIRLKFVYCRNQISDENFKLQLCTVAQGHALGTHTKFQFEILTIKEIPGIVYFHYCDLTMGAIASQITCFTVVYSTVYSGTDQRKHQSSTSLAFIRGIHRWPVNSPHKGPVMRRMFPFDDIIMFARLFWRAHETLVKHTHPEL